MKGATSIQERLWELRKDKGLNLEELSELTGISKSALGSYEKEDYKEINHGNLITLADFYGVSVDYLLCRTENREQIYRFGSTGRNESIPPDVLPDYVDVLPSGWFPADARQIGRASCRERVS